MANFKLTQSGQQIQDDLNLIDDNGANVNQVLTADGNGGCSWQDNKSELYICTYGTTTFAQVTQAINDGKLPVVTYDGYTYIYNRTSSKHLFVTNLQDKNRLAYVSTTNNWATSSTSLETVSNKVTSISASSTDTQYPSAKCVYDQLESKVSSTMGYTEV